MCSFFLFAKFPQATRNADSSWLVFPHCSWTLSHPTGLFHCPVSIALLRHPSSTLLSGFLFPTLSRVPLPLSGHVEDRGLRPLFSFAPKQTKRLSAWRTPPNSVTPQHWLTAAWKESEPLQLPCTALMLSIDLRWIMSIHEQCGHSGIKQVLYFSKMVDPAVKKVDIRMVVQRCEACQSIDLTLVQWQKGIMSATHVWNRLEIDVTHVGSQLYLTIINCCPSCFAIWWLLYQQDTASITCQMESIFYNWGPHIEILTDNGVAFSLEQFL